MPASDAPDYESMAARLESSGHYRVLRRLRPGQSVRPGTGKMRRAVFIDVETTGLEFGTDEIIEIGLVPFEYDSEGQVTRILAPYQSFQEPSISIPQEISALTGIPSSLERLLRRRSTFEAEYSGR